MAEGIRTTCAYCGVGCGILAGDGDVIRGDAEHPANFGRLCSKGSALGETLGLEGRLLKPRIAGIEAEWDEALDLIAQRFTAAIAQHGPDAVAFYVSGQFLTEDYYVANKLMKGFIGSGNIDTNSRLCMASSVAGHRRAFGEDVVPGCYEDFDEAHLAVLVGSNTAWCHPVLYQRLAAAREARGTKIVVIDPRRTATAAEADLHLALKPGTDVLLFNGLLVHLDDKGALDHHYIGAHTAGFDATLALAEADAGSIDKVAAGCGLDPADVQRFYDWFATTERSLTAYSQGVNQSAHGTDKVNAIINVHLATGRIGRAGMGPFSITGQPNAMGGREVGGLANQLAAHMAFEDEGAIDRVRRFWGAQRMAMRPGLKAIDMFDAVADGRIKALWIAGTNPAVSLPDAGRVRAALKKCDFVVVSDVTITDTTRYAHVLLPAAAWGEKDGTVTNSERRISRQRALRPLPGEARPDWRIITEIAQRMGFAAGFHYRSPAEIFREHAALSAFENDGARQFDLGRLADLSDAEYDALAPVQWPIRQRSERLFGDGRFSTPDGRARFVAVRQEGPAVPVSGRYPIILNTGRLRDQWHTMTRTGSVPRLMAHAPAPAIELAPADATTHGLSDGSFAQIRSAQGTAIAQVRVTGDQQTGAAFLSMHWSNQFSAQSVAGLLVNRDADPWSGQPELKHTPIALAPLTMRWNGFLLSRRAICPTGLVHWSKRAVAGGWLYELMGPEPASDGILLARRLLDRVPREGAIEYFDARRGMFRAGLTDLAGRLTDCLFVGPADMQAERDWLVALFAECRPLSDDDRRALLSGRAPVAMPPEGRVVCSCFQVGIDRIAATVRRERIGDVAALGRRLQCGTNCGSCLPELREIIAHERLLAAE
ncbi:MAG TPA: molybdopterin-dependent oxidoreductase [Dongiaceae bacterium]|jgi:assimilatory nitrate reductase catalytic subunit|nr:molybdopterin-dependent oxidoreductase [Dongiaceae bacterium]